MTPRTIAIAGCGPAGLAAALFLSRSGHRITLVERFEAPRPLGSGLMIQPTGFAVLRRLGLEAAILAHGARIARLYGRSNPGGRLVLDVRYAALSPDMFGLAVHRASLFGVLHAAVQAAGLEIRTGFEVTGLDSHADGRRSLVDGKGGRLGPFDLVIDALGTRSPLPGVVFGRNFARPLTYGALWASLPWPVGSDFAPDALEQTYERASIMVGVLPIGRRAHQPHDEAAFFWSLKPGTYDDWRRAGLSPWKDQVRRLWPATAPLLDDITDPDQMVLARYGHHTLPYPAAPGIAFIGDCAHSASPQLGQGANMALIDALALSLALDTTPDMTAALADYARLRRRHVRVYQAMSRMFTPFYQSDSHLLPFLRDRLVAPLTRLPLARRLLATLVAGTLVEPVSGRWPDDAHPGT